jgi:VIT1/CCC1 family predicted Fe2+/Mn2+ transporter
VIRNGPVPLLLHGLIEYLVGALFVLAPFLFGFDDNAATALAIIVGVVILLFALATDYPAGVVRSMPLAAHIVLDYVLGIFLIAAPFLFGFDEETAPFAFFVVLGVAHLVITTVTRFDLGRRRD